MTNDASRHTHYSLTQTSPAAPEPEDAGVVIPRDWLDTHNRLCPCGEIVTERGWVRHPAKQTTNGGTQ